MIIDFSKYKAEKEPHREGPAKCLTCEHTWHAVAPVGVVWFECPCCHLEHGKFEGACIPAGACWHCDCGNSVFYITEDGFECPMCGSSWTR